MLPEKSGGRIVLEGKYPGGLQPWWEKSGWEMSVVENGRDGKCPGRKSPGGKCPGGKCPGWEGNLEDCGLLPYEVAISIC